MEAATYDDGASARLELWQCPICLDTLVEPMLTTCCGHSFCGVCLDAALRRVDACPLCRTPLLSGAHSMTRNRALDELLKRMDAKATDDGFLLTIRDDANKSDRVAAPTRWTEGIRRWTSRLRAAASRWSAPPVRLQQWLHWFRVHWTTLQCVFYVLVFGAFVFFLRVQEEDFAEHEVRPRRFRPQGP